MHSKIKKLADDAIALQNKNGMDAALREISAMCADVEPPAEVPAKKVGAK